jgi:hypothetical protein
VLPLLLRLAAASPSLGVRGAALYAIGALARTPRGRRFLAQHGYRGRNAGLGVAIVIYNDCVVRECVFLISMCFVFLLCVVLAFAYC